MYKYLSRFYSCEIVELSSLLGRTEMCKISLVDLIRLVFAVKFRIKNNIPSTVVISFSDLPNLVNSLSFGNSIISITGFPLKKSGFGYFSYILWKYILNMLTFLFSKVIVPCSPVVIPSFLLKVKSIRTKVFIINGFLDISRLVIDDSLLSTLKSDFPHGYFLYIGRIDQNKSVSQIIESFILSCELRSLDQKPLPLLIVGSGPSESFCKNIISKYNSRSQVDASDRSIPCIYYRQQTENPYTFISNASAVLLGSKSEGFSNVALESLFANTPIFLSANKGNKFLYDFLGCQKWSSLVQLLPPLSNRSSLSVWASSMSAFEITQLPSTYRMREEVMRKCSADANIAKWIDVIESI